MQEERRLASVNLHWEKERAFVLVSHQALFSGCTTSDSGRNLQNGHSCRSCKQWKIQSFAPSGGSNRPGLCEKYLLTLLLGQSQCLRDVKSQGRRVRRYAPPPPYPHPKSSAMKLEPRKTSGSRPSLNPTPVQDRCKELQEQASRYRDVVALLERRISMLEHTLQQERFETQIDHSPPRARGYGMPAAGDVLVSHPVTQPSTPGHIPALLQTLFA